MSLIPNSRVYRDKDGRKVVAVDLVQSPGQAVKVDVGHKGVTKHVYNRVNSVPVASETLIVSFVVPPGKGFDLSNATASGDNISEYIVKVNDSVIQVKRSWWSNFNVDFNFYELALVAGDKVEIFVENRGNDPVTYDATLIGGEYDE